MRKMQPVPFEDVTFEDRFWAPRIRTNREATIPHILGELRRRHWIVDFRLKDKTPERPHRDSDVFKWIEAAALSLKTAPDKSLERRIDRVVELIAGAQEDDGYLNTYFTTVKPDMKWQSLRHCHELYNLGHLAEAAVAYRQATGKCRLLDVARRALDLVDSLFGPERGKRRGYPGHEEVELALVKLYRDTGEERYLGLAKYFIDERGRKPNYFDLESKRRGVDPKKESWAVKQVQAHLPVREQKTAEGHAVRMMYLLCGMADVAVETGDVTLIKACRRLWKNVVGRRMYVTGGIGSDPSLERFTFDHDLPNERGYAESCAAIGLVFFAHRMLQVEGDAEYADVMERVLYNGYLSSVALDGRDFFYANALAMVPETTEFARATATAVRRPWFPCPCCPANIARLMASLGQYVYSQSARTAYIHLYVQGRAVLALSGGPVVLRQKTAYPWKQEVKIEVLPEKPVSFTLALRIPGWCRRATCTVNGRSLELRGITRKGYARIKRAWRKGDVVTLTLAMPVEVVRSRPEVRANAGRVALQRGPVVYCFEEADNGNNLNALALSSKGLRAVTGKAWPRGVPAIVGRARRSVPGGRGGALYGSQRSPTRSVRVRAVPYCLWNHRGAGEMLVWIREMQD